MTVLQVSRRYGNLMRLTRWLAITARTAIDREHYERLRHCLWARYTRELRLAVMRH